MVVSGESIAGVLQFSPFLIGLLFVAIGTSLPELVFGTHAVLRRQPELALGDIIGSVIASSTLVLGVTALITPIVAEHSLVLIGAAFMLVLAFMFHTFISYGRLQWRTGVSLLLFYLLFFIVGSNARTLLAG